MSKHLVPLEPCLDPLLSCIILPNIGDYTRRFFSLRCNPFHQEGETASHAWFDSYGIMSGPQREKFFSCNFCLLVSLLYPDADLEHLRPAMDFMLWLFAFDDMADLGDFRLEGLKRAVDITMNVLQKPDDVQPELKIAATLHSFFDRMRRNGSPQAIKHFVEATEKYTRAITQEMADKHTGHVQTLEEYRKCRQDTSGVKLSLAALEYAHKIDMPDQVLHDPTISELSLAANEILTWANDIFSFRNEQARGHTHNLVYILMWHNQLGVQEAVNYANHLIEKRVDDYLQAKSSLDSFGPYLDGEITRYIQGIEYCIQACIDWTFMTIRYFGTDTAKVKETGVVKLAYTADL
ncbi:unnamed protein product [Rhizoctonia solani]|uniref:Terpene synthase n=3 Tax=Rhizoctonia solani TaxID=456999 RepID=A0A8H3DPG0_9AGAM|nr:terpene synthase family, metal-binding domain protein [Rhizoctonia solani AG-3 Rhs1AP]KEP46244.1 terpene synthase family, metal-binding domain protein [Rhizoctonia solani 123E]CAE6390814.1 unnamed protein product [Rhizoctonia solani]CAE6537092.1 unnamed protein product [Rhizoctonia solani]